LYGHARDFVAVLVYNNYRMPVSGVVLNVLGKFLGNNSRMSFSFFRIRESSPDFIPVEFPIAGVEIVSRHVEAQIALLYPADAGN
jgi:hypothetical protein